MSDPQEAATPSRRLDPEFKADLIDFARERIQMVWNDVPGGVDAATLASNVVAAQEFLWLSLQFPVEAATPSDPHSAEAEARYPDPPPPTPWDYMSPPEEVRERERDAFIAGRVSRDAEVAELRAEKERWHDAALIGLAQESAARSEVAELKAKIAAAVARLNAASIPPMMTEAQFNATTITDARRILLGSASSPVEGGN